MEQPAFSRLVATGDPQQPAVPAFTSNLTIRLCCSIFPDVLHDIKEDHNDRRHFRRSQDAHGRVFTSSRFVPDTRWSADGRTSRATPREQESSASATIRFAGAGSVMEQRHREPVLWRILPYALVLTLEFHGRWRLVSRLASAFRISAMGEWSAPWPGADNGWPSSRPAPPAELAMISASNATAGHQPPSNHEHAYRR